MAVSEYEIEQFEKYRPYCDTANEILNLLAEKRLTICLAKFFYDSLHFGENVGNLAKKLGNWGIGKFFTRKFGNQCLFL